MPEKTPTPNHVYRVQAIRVIDGDTFIFRVDVGFRAYREESIRLKDFDTPELRPRKAGRTKEDLANEKARALLAMKFVHAIFENAEEIRIRTDKDKMTFNRYVAEVWYKEGEGWFNLAEELEKAGHAK